MARRSKLVVAILLACAVLFLVALADAAQENPGKGGPKPPKHPKPPNDPKPPKKQPKPVKMKCKIRSFKYCYNYPIPCPAKCPYTCYINCLTCAPVCLCNVPGAVCQDPRFVGADGVTFYFHGKKDKDFCLVSDSDLHINAHFIGKRNPEMSRDFTWIQSIGILFGSHKLYLGALKTSTWDDAEDRVAISFDGEAVALPQGEGARWTSSVGPALSVVRTSDTNAVVVEVEGKFKITASVVPITGEESRVHNYGITDEDCFAHLELGFKFYSLTDDVHGVLGQTYREDYVTRVKMSSNMPIMSGEPKYATPSLFSTDCEVARFGRGTAGAALAAEQSDLICQSRMNGRGVVCKR